MSTNNKEAAEREAFEKWAVEHCAPLLRKHEVLGRAKDGTYLMFSVEWNWQAWLARSALTASEGPATEQAPLREYEDRIDELQKVIADALGWIEVSHRPPVRDEMEHGRMVGIRLHALADLHLALYGEEAKPVQVSENDYAELRAALSTPPAVPQKGWERAAAEALYAKLDEIDGEAHESAYFAQDISAHHQRWVELAAEVIVLSAAPAAPQTKEQT